LLRYLVRTTGRWTGHGAWRSVRYVRVRLVLGLGLGLGLGLVLRSWLGQLGDVGAMALREVLGMLGLGSGRVRVRVKLEINVLWH
jgi:hypothetical protein